MRCAHTMRFGAALRDGGGASFRLWAPAATRVELVLHRPDGAEVLPTPLADEGWAHLSVADAHAGLRYQWRIDGELLVPDPASRCNPEGPHGASTLIDPAAFLWDDDWHGRPWHEAAFYQLHVGCFTPQGTFDAAAARLPELAALGVTAVQLMPVADFPGEFGWGYDGVLPFAPYHGYGPPEALKRFIQSAHRLGLMVFADVVYNHFGPDGNYLSAYAPAFFSERHRTAWGAAINFDGQHAATVREFFVTNALYWLQEYRFDGLRVDAAHAMLDDSEPHILQLLSERVRKECIGRHVHLVLENDSNDERRLARPATPGAFDGQWNGDVHHTLHVQLTDEHDGYYAEYDQPVAQLARCLTQGFARQGGPHNAEGAAPRRAATGRAPLGAMVNFLQNHDQIGNRAFGDRLQSIADPAALRLATAIVALAPSPPMWFMGEEWGSTTPFMYFADWQGDLRLAVQQGRQQEFAHFPRYAEAARAGTLPDPCSRQTFERCKLDDTERLQPHALERAAFHRDLLSRRAQHLWPRLPQLADDGHAALHEAALLQVHWRFNASPQSARARLQMQVNLSADAIPAPELPAGAGELLTLGETTGGGLGAWSGRWHWLPEEG